MKYIFILLAILFFNKVVFAQKITDDFSGKWKAPKGAIIIVTKVDDGFIGKTEIEKAVVLKDVKFYNGKWIAVVLNPKADLVANCELILYSTKLKIIAKKGVFRRTLYWIKQ